VADETLEWDLKVDADTSGGTRMDSVLGKLDQTMNLLGVHLGHIEENTRKVSKAHDDHGGHANGLMGALQRVVHQGMEPFLHKAKEIAEFEFIREGTQRLLELPGELAHEVFALGEEMLDAARKQERFGIAFRNSLGEEAAEETLGYIEKIGHHTEFTQHQLKNMNLELAKSGFKGGDLARANEALIDLASMSANPEAGADAAMGALRRLMTSGKLDARALRPFGISQKTFFDELSKETGIGVTSLKKQMDKGKVDVGASLNSLYTVITNKTGKALGGAGADMEKTFNVRLKNLKEIPELLGEKLSGTKGYAAISDFVGRMADAFSPESESGQRIFAGLTSIIDTLGTELEGVDLKGIASQVSGAMTTISSAIGPVIHALEALYHAASTAFGAFEKVVNFMGVEKFTDELARREYGGPSRGARVPENFDLSKAKAELARRMKTGEFKHNMMDDLAAGAAQGGAPAFRMVGDQFGSAVEEGFRKKTKTHSPSQLFAELGMDVAEGFASGVEDSAAMVDNAFRRMTEPALPGAGGGAGGGGGTPTIQVILQQRNEISGGGADMESIPDQIAEKTKEIVPGMIQSALEQLAMQTGSSR
jgi:tape measure domain-containing protein